MKKLLVIAAVLSACKYLHSPTDPLAESTRPFPCDGIVHPLSQADTLAVQNAAVDEMRNAIAAHRLIPASGKAYGVDRTPPAVDYVACDWQATGTVNGGKTTITAWIAGMTDYRAWRIKVKTNEPTRTAPLVRWETLNAYLEAIGRGDLTDLWPGNGLDPRAP